MAASKYFGIGLQRTGTASLCKAFQLLGFKARHGDYLRFPGALCLKDPIYNQYDFFCDTPFAFLYDKLDLAFPGSKFIYTFRHVDLWLKSVERLFTVNDQFSLLPSAAKHHVLMYGQSSFDPKIAKAVFLKHQRDVRAHFIGRDNLLELELGDSFGWAPLCKLTGRNRPDAEFPFFNRL